MDARGAGVMDLAWGEDARAPPLTEVLYCALIADVI